VDNDGSSLVEVDLSINVASIYPWVCYFSIWTSIDDHRNLFGVV